MLQVVYFNYLNDIKTYKSCPRKMIKDDSFNNVITKHLKISKYPNDVLQYASTIY
jgi:hypothetical protein